MKKTVPIIVGGILLLGLAGGGLWYWQQSQAPSLSAPKQEAVSQVEKEAQEPESTDSFTGKIKEAIMRGASLKCAYEDNMGNSHVGYISDRNYFAEVTSGGRTGYLIIKDDCMWTWGQQEGQGVKMCFQPEEGEEGIWDSESAPQDDYHCVPAVVSGEKFTPPSDIEFLDVGAMLEGIE